MSTTVRASETQVITYNPPQNWQPLRQFPTALWTKQKGSNASFTFTGKEIAVFGTVPSKKVLGVHGPLVRFLIDGNDPSSSPIKFHRQDNPQSNMQMFQRSFPTFNDTHTLTIASEMEGGLLILNSMVVSNFPDIIPLPSQSPPSSSIVNPSGPSPSFDPNSSRSSSAPSSEIVSSSKVNVGGIVGGVIAALVVLASLVAFLLYRRRRRMEAARRTTPFTVTPFISEYSKPSSPDPEPLKTKSVPGTVPSLPFFPPPPIPPPDKKHDPPPAFVAGTSDFARHGSMYKPRRSEESLPPTEYGYGVGMSRDEWIQYEPKSKS